MLHWPAQPWLSRARRSHHSAAMNPTVLGVQHRQPSACNFQVAQASRPVIVRCAEDGLDVPLPAAAYMDTEAKLQQLNSLKRKLHTAVAQEDYATAQQFKQQADELKQQLPPLQQYTLHQAEKLQSSDPVQRRAAVRALAEVGDESCIPDLASCLHDPELNPPATDALWAVFHRHPNPEVKALMDQGLALLHPGTPLVRLRSALQVYEEACRLEPSYAEAHNKRATVLYLMHRYEESIEVCKLVLELNPHHFGAASGMGMCYLQLEDHKAALQAFEQALAINPAMDPIQTYVAALRAKLADDAGR